MEFNRRWLDAASKFFMYMTGAWLAAVKMLENSSYKGDDAAQFASINSIPIWLVILGLSMSFKLWAIRRTATDRKKGVRLILMALVTLVMKTPDSFSERNYRATLFQYKTVCFKGWWENRKVVGCRPWSGWLIGFCRSGRDAPSVKTVFRAPQQSLGSTAGHGVCGTAWSLKQCSAHHLPAITASSGQPLIERYARRAFMHPDEVSERRVVGRSLARSLHAEQIVVAGKNWGVLVYDSVDASAVIDDMNAASNKVGIQSLSLFIEEFAQ